MEKTQALARAATHLLTPGLSGFSVTVTKPRMPQLWGHADNTKDRWTFENLSRNLRKSLQASAMQGMST